MANIDGHLDRISSDAGYSAPARLFSLTIATAAG